MKRNEGGVVENEKFLQNSTIRKSMEIIYPDTLSPYRYIRQSNEKLPNGYSLNTLSSKQTDNAASMSKKADWHAYMSKHNKDKPNE